MKISSRGIVDIGHVCNLSCLHCYFLLTIRKWKPLYWIMANILLIRICRMDKIDITGGEPSIYPHITFLVLYCRFLGFDEIRIVTNGSTGHRLQKLYKMKKVKFSVSHHVTDSRSVKALTGKDVNKEVNYFIVTCLDKINYINIVITPYNTNVLNIIKQTKILTGNTTICFKHLDYNFKHGIESFRIRHFRTVLNNAIRNELSDSKSEYQPNIDLRFFPFCFLDEDLRQNSRIRCCSAITNTYDQNDWLPVISRITPLRRYIKFIFGNDSTREREAIAQARIQGKSECAHSKQCDECIYLHKCDGIQKGYIKRFGTDELAPI